MSVSHWQDHVDLSGVTTALLAFSWHQLLWSCRLSSTALSKYFKWCCYVSWFLKRALIHLFSVKSIVWVSFSVFKEPYCILEIFNFSKSFFFFLPRVAIINYTLKSWSFWSGAKTTEITNDSWVTEGLTDKKNLYYALMPRAKWEEVDVLEHACDISCFGQEGWTRQSLEDPADFSYYGILN